MPNIIAKMGNLSIGEIVNSPSLGNGPKGSSKPANGGMPTHPLIISENDGAGLRIDLDFRNGGGLFKDADKTFDEDVIEPLFKVLTRHRGITKHFTILMTFGKHWNESVNFKKAQSALIRRVAKMVNTFPGLNTVEVCFELKKKNWSQLKNATYFYQLKFRGWTFHHKVTKGAGVWEKMEIRSDLDRRLAGFRFALQKKGEL